MFNTTQTVHPYKLGDTGSEQEVIEVLPVKEPLSVPAEPATPVVEPEPVGA